MGKKWKDTKRRNTGLLLLLTLAMVLAACGAPGGDEVVPTTAAGGGADTTTAAADTTAAGGDTTGGTETTAAPGGDGATIRIGVLAPVTGTVALSGQDMLDGFNLYWEQQDQMSGDIQIEIIHEDSAGDPSTGLNKAQLLVGNENVDMIVGPLLANVGLAVAEEMSREGVPLFLPIVSADDLTQRQRLDGVIRIGGWTSSQTTHPMGQWAYDQGYERVVTLCTDYAFGHENCGGFSNTFTDAGGEIVEQLWNPLGTQDFSTYVTQIRDADADAAFVLSVGADSTRVVQAWSDFGLKGEIPMLGGETTLDQSLLRNMGPEAEGLISTGHYAEGRDSAETQQFVDAYDEAYGQLPSYYSVGMYTGARWIDQAIQAVGGDISDQEAFLTAIREVQFDDTPLGPVSLDDYDNPIQNVYIREVQTREDGRLWNVPIETFENVSQFWEYDPEEFLDHPVYSREYQGNGVWPEPNPG
ncbi:MAG: ABC transporter substrate-binding protein [Acidimicrobiia bacterium]|nr:ABC transporter substrate-binding protein [Acidimicrobiia bacterium]